MRLMIPLMPQCPITRLIASVRSRSAVFASIVAISVAPSLRSQPAPPIHWISFRWESATIGGHLFQRAAILIPVELAGVAGRHFLQLDTGAGWPMWYEVPMRHLKAVATVGDTVPDEVVLHAKLGDRRSEYSINSDTFLIRKAFGDTLTNSDGLQPIGTLGVRFFRHRILVIDFPHQRLAILDDSAAVLPDQLSSRATFVPLAYTNGYVFVPLVINGTVFNDFFYDTGASLFPLTTTLATWRTLTGRGGDEADNTVWRVTWWGSLISEIGAPALGSVQVGAFRADHPLVFHQAESAAHPDFFASVPYHVGGTFGNALFYDRDVVIIDLPHRRFGVAESR